MDQSAQQYTLQDLFDRAIRIEKQAGSIYRELEKRFSHDREAAALWRALAADEDSHAAILSSVLRDAPADKLARPAPDEVWYQVTHILNVLSRDLLASIENLRDAYELAHQLEYSEVNAVFEFLSVDALPGKVEREFIRKHIAEHQKRLSDFMMNYKGDWYGVLPMSE